MSEKTLVAPTLNLNGTSRASLMEGYLDCLEALRVVQDELQKISPHGRDYQTVTEERYKLAVAQHRARCVAVQGVIDEIAAIAQNVHDQTTGR